MPSVRFLRSGCSQLQVDVWKRAACTDRGGDLTSAQRAGHAAQEVQGSRAFSRTANRNGLFKVTSKASGPPAVGRTLGPALHLLSVQKNAVQHLQSSEPRHHS